MLALNMFKRFIIFLLISSAYGDKKRKCEKTVTTASGERAPKHFCSGDLIFEDNFDKLNLENWQHEITLAGGGNWEFQWYTNNRSNSFVQDGNLHIRPTLTSDDIGEENLSKMTLDINGGGPAQYCTNPTYFGCTRVGTKTHILNPVKSARLRTVKSFNFKYGKAEIKAKMPSGDWLWPAIWLLPKNDQYGGWPSSGEIDIVESRGNKNLMLNGKNIGSEMMGSTLHWGPNTGYNAYERTHFELNTPKDQGYETGFRRYQMEWTPDHLKFMVDGVEVGTVAPEKSFWDLGEYNKTGLANPWRSGTKMAPFDEEFFIILNLAVGSTSFFPDSAVNDPPKPWKNNSPHAITDFWDGHESWLPTWNMKENEGYDSSLVVDYVRVWAL